MRYYCSGSNDRIVADCHALGDHDICAYPNSGSDPDWSRMENISLFRVNIMIQSSKYSVMTDKCSVSNYDSALILELTAGIYKYVVSYCDVFPKISMKRRFYFHPLTNRFCRDPGEQIRDLIFVLMPYIVHLEKQTSVFLNLFSHGCNNFRVVSKRSAAVKISK